MPTPPGAGMPKPVSTPAGAAAPTANGKDWQGKGAGGNLPGASFLKGFTKAAGWNDATSAIDAAQKSNIDYDLMAKQKAKADADKEQQPSAEPDTSTAEPAVAPVAGKSGELSPGASKPGATGYGPNPAQPVTLANPIGQPGATPAGAAIQRYPDPAPAGSA